jgi:hypothetical protein
VHPLPSSTITRIPISDKHASREADSNELQLGRSFETQDYQAPRRHESIDPLLLALDRRESRDFSPSYELLEILANTTPAVSQVVLHQLRVNLDPKSVLEWLKGNITTNIRLSGHKVARSVTPPVQSPRELQLMVQHPVAYPRLDPDNLKQSRGIPFELLDIMPEKYRAESVSSIMDQQKGDSSKGKTAIHEAQPAVTRPIAKSSMNYGPTKAPAYFDPCLANLDIRFWSTIPVDSSFAAEVISIYLETDHPVLSPFEPAFFLSGLVGNDISICSAFEINALLAFASVNDFLLDFEVRADNA